MSYDMHIGRNELNFTFNATPFFRYGFGQKGIRLLDGMTGLHSVPLIIKCHDLMVRDEHEVRLLEKSASFGSYDQTIAFLMNMLEAAKKNQDFIWQIN